MDGNTEREEVGAEQSQSKFKKEQETDRLSGKPWRKMAEVHERYVEK